MASCTPFLITAGWGERLEDFNNERCFPRWVLVKCASRLGNDLILAISSTEPVLEVWPLSLALSMRFGAKPSEASGRVCSWVAKLLISSWGWGGISCQVQ